MTPAELTGAIKALETFADKFDAFRSAEEHWLHSSALSEAELYRAQLAAQPPAVDRERRLREALETLNHAAKVAISTQYGSSFDEDTPLVIRLLDGTCDATDELLADQPPPDPREAALEKAVVK